MSSTGKARLIRSGRLTMQSLRGPTFQASINGDEGAIANDYLWGGYAPQATEIPYGWLTPPARWRPDPPRNFAAIARTSGSTAYARNRDSIDAVGEKPFAATLDTQVVDDPANYATWIVGNYTAPRSRMPQLQLNLLSRTPTECWRILGRRIGDAIRITGTPGSARQLLANPRFDGGVSGWTGDGAAVAQSAVWSRSGGFSMRVTPAGGGPDARAVATTTVVAGAEYDLDGWLFSPGGFAVAAIQVTWVNSSGADISTSSTSVTALVAGVAQRYTATFTAPAGAVTAKVFTVEGGPAAGDVYYADEVTFTGVDRAGWPDGVTHLVIEGIAHSVAADTRFVVWNTAPVIGAEPGEAGPWFRADESTADTGSDLLAF